MSFIFDCFSKTPPEGKEGPTQPKSVEPPPPPPAPPPPPPKLTYEILKLQNAKTSATIIKILEKDATFAAFGECEADDIIKRDDEDGEKLQAGIQISIDNGVIPKMDTPPEYMLIDVIGKTPDQISDVIINGMGKAATEGGVVVLCGLSGTGKGTTVAKLQERLPTCVTWSNGNIFRSLTLLAVTWCELFNLPEFDPKAALTPANLAGFMKMLSFGKFNGKWDIKVKGLGLDFLVSEVSNTLLKEPKVGKHIPTVAERTQGEVIHFASSATSMMGKDGFIVLLEGRQQTVDYVPTPHRFTLVMSDTTVLGQRRAAQRLGAAVLGALPKPEDVKVQVTKPKNGAEESGSGGSDDKAGAEEEVAGVLEPSDELIADTLSVKLDELAYEAGCDPLLQPELAVTLAIGSPMGLTVREIEPDNFLLVTGVEPGGQGCRSGVRIGYFLREVAGETVSSLEEVFSALKKAKEAGAPSFELRLTATPPAVEPTSPAGLRGVSNGQRAHPVPLVVAGPSGVGKGTLIGKVLQEFPGLFGFSVSHTTRAPRAGEADGRDYHFTTKESMQDAIGKGEFLEHAAVHGNFYGTSFAAVKDVAAQGKVCILDIDVQGCKSVKACPQSSMPQQPHFVFIAPPSMDALKSRLESRGTETPEKIKVRLAAAQGEIDYGLAKGNMDLVIVNDDLDEAYEKLVAQLASWYPHVAAALGMPAAPNGGAGNGAELEEDEDEEDEEGEEDGETPEELLVRCGLGAYAPAFVKFGVETVADVATSARLLTDEELGAELGMAEKDIAVFREIFGGASDEEGEEEEDEDEDDDDDDDDL